MSKRTIKEIQEELLFVGQALLELNKKVENLIKETKNYKPDKQVLKVQLEIPIFTEKSFYD